jgi:hypothetical protein
MDLEQLPDGAAPIGLLSAEEFLPSATAFDEALLAAATGPKIGLVFCADHRAMSHSNAYATAHFGPMGVDTTIIEHGEGHEDVDIIYMAGGSPVDLIGCTRLRARWPEIEQRWRAGDLTLAGSSAGAMALCTYTLVPTPGATAPSRWTTEGFGPLERTALAVHAKSRSDEWLELVAAAKPEGVQLVALDDDAGILLRPGAPAEVIGPGRARVL